MIIAVCDPKGIAIEAIKTILYPDKGLSDRISRIYEFWNMEQLLDASRDSSFDCIATVYKGNIIKNLIMDCQSYTKYRPNETTGGIFVSWRRKEELPTGA